MQNTLLKKHKSLSGTEIILVTISALIVGVLLTAVAAAYKSLLETTSVEYTAESSLSA